MADQTPNNPTPSPAPGDQPVPPRKSRLGRRILIGAGVLVVLLVLLVVLIPTIASTGFVRNFVVGKVNDGINGRVTIENWSLSWTGGVDVNGVSVVDTAGRKVIDLRKLRTDLSLFDAIKGRYDLGKVTVDGLHLDVVMNADGSNNLQSIAKPSDQPMGALPNIKADVVLTDGQARVSGHGVPEPVAASFGGQVTIPDLNQTITDSLNATLTVGGRPAGKIDLSGTASVFKNGLFDDKTASVAQKLNIQGLQLASIAPFVPKTSITTLQGVTDGAFALDLKNGSAGTMQGQLATRNVSATGPAINGDTFQSDQVAVTIPATSVAMANGLADWQAYRVRTGGDAPAPITVALGNAPGGAALGGMQVSMDAAVNAVLNAAGGKAPGSDGKVQVNSNLDLAALSRMLPKTLNLVEGVQIQSAGMTQQATVTLTAQDGTFQTATDLSAISGVNTKDGNKPIAIRPIHLDASASTGGGGAAGFRNLALNLTSGFATANFKGQTLADLAGEARGDLKAMRDELGQVVNFGTLDTAGTFHAKLASSGNLAEQGGRGKVDAQVTLENLRVAGLSDGKAIDQKWMNIAAAGTLVRGTDKFINALQDGTLTVKTGDPGNPTIDVVTAANVNLSGATPTIGFALQKLFIDAARAQAEFAAFVPGDYRVTAGTINATAVGTWSNGTLTLENLNATPSNLTVNLQSKDGKSTQVINALTMAVDAAGTVATGDQQTINLSKLNLTEANKRLVLQKVSDGPLLLTTGPAGFSGNGKLRVGADLAFVNTLMRAFSGAGQQVVAQAKSGEIRTGTLDGTLGFDSAAGKPTTLAGEFNIANLVVTTATGATQPEAITLTLQAAAPADFSSVAAQNVALKSRFANLLATDSVLLLKSPDGAPVGTFDQLQKANVSLDVPDVGAFYTIASALMPPAPAAGAQSAATLQQRAQAAIDRTGPVGSQVIARVADAAGRPLPQATTAEQLAGPLSVTGGRATAKLTVARANGVTTLTVSDLSGRGVQLRRGSKSHTVEPFTMRLVAAVRNSGDQIAQIDVSQLTGKLGVADLTMDQPISIKNSGADQMAASGAIRLAGQLEKASSLLEVLNAQPVPYAGTYAMVQKLNTEGYTVGLTGSVDLTNFQVLDDTGKVSFAEQKVTIANDLKIDQKAKNLAGKLDVNSQAIAVQFNGGVKQFDAARQIVDGTTLALDYDAAKVWQIVRPMLSPETLASISDLQVAGVKQASFKLGGAYPANVPFQRAITSMTASGALPLDSLQVNGITAQQVNPGFTLAGGKLTITAGPGATPVVPTAAPGAATQPPAAPMVVTALVNGGTVDLTDAVVDLTTPEATITTPPNKALAHNVALNAVLAKYANQVIPVFDVGNQSAVANLTVVRCERLPLGSTMTAPNNGGYAEIIVSLADVKPGGPVIGGIDQFVGNFLGTSARATVQPTTIVLSDGSARISNFALAVGENQRQLVKLDGVVSLAEGGALNLTANIPADMIKRFGRDVLKYLPAGVDLPIGGTKETPQFAGADKVIAGLVKQAAVNAAAAALTGGGKDGKETGGGGGGLGDILGNVIGGGGKQPAQQPAPQTPQRQKQQQAPAQNSAPQQNQQPAAAQPAEPTPAEAIGGLLNSLTRDREKKPDAQPQQPAKRQQPKPADPQPGKKKQ
jgi:hypothetical protein